MGALIRFVTAPKRAAALLLYPWWPVRELFRPAIGRAYNITLAQKFNLVRSMWRNAKEPGAASAFYEIAAIVLQILQIPPEVEGAVAEFGCFKGISTASLSLACALTGRHLIVFDSFEGLPDPGNTVHNFDTGHVIPYEKGQFAGSLDEVRANVSRLGNVDVCEFVKGYFDQTLPKRDEAEKYALIFEDADLPDSVRAVLQFAWHRLQPQSRYFCHEARDREVVDLFFDRQWWQDNLGEQPPGFIGSGCGILSGPTDWCCLGYTVRRP